MKWKFVSGIIILLVSLPLVGFSQEATYPVSLEYNRTGKFSIFRKKAGPILGIAPFQDQRSVKVYIGRYVLMGSSDRFDKADGLATESANSTATQRSNRRRGQAGLQPPAQSPAHNSPSYFKSEPVPLVGAIQKSIREAISGSGVATIPVSGWDGKAESMKDMKVDSILIVVVKRFWVEGSVVGIGTKLNASMHFIFYLGVKKLGKVFIEHVFVEKNTTLGMLATQDVAQWINRTSADALDSFLRNPY